jgi:hypothetical protein
MVKVIELRRMGRTVHVKGTVKEMHGGLFREIPNARDHFARPMHRSEVTIKTNFKEIK